MKPNSSNSPKSTRFFSELSVSQHIIIILKLLEIIIKQTKSSPALSLPYKSVQKIILKS